jgi:GTP-binding protein Era
VNEKDFRAGFVALLGKPNAGKSTLMNALVGAKLAAVSGLPQTTRERLSGIYTDENRQIVFVDLPGMTAPTDRLNEALRLSVLENISEVEAVLHLVDVEDQKPLDDDVAEALRFVRRPMILLITKLDGKHREVDAREWASNRIPKKVLESYHAILGVSARDGRGLAELLDQLAALMPFSPPLYDPEDLTDRDLRYLAQEAIREKAFTLLHEELPYSVAVQIEDFKERERGKWYISANIFVERESQKGMVIGRGGEMLKKISQAARRDIEELAGAPVYLDLWVKVREKWRKNERDLEQFGYKTPKGKKRRR